MVRRIMTETFRVLDEVGSLRAIVNTMRTREYGACVMRTR